MRNCWKRKQKNNDIYTDGRYIIVVVITPTLSWVKNEDKYIIQK